MTGTVREKCCPVVIALCCALASLLPAPAAAEAPKLGGPMARLGFLAGHTWKCSSIVTDGGKKQPPIELLMIAETVAGNAVHIHLSAAEFVGDQYYGYDSKKGEYWEVSANNDGTQLYQTSADGLSFSGYIQQMQRVRISDHFVLQDPSRLLIHDVTLLPSGKEILTDSTCAAS